MPIRTGAVIAAALLFSQGALADCRYSASREAEVDTNGARKAVIKAAAGDLSVRGSSSANRAHAKGQACADSQKDLDAIRIEARREGDTVYIETVLPDDDSWMRHDSLDLTVELPASLEVRLEDSSGDLSVEGVKDLRVDDSSGDQRIRNIGGNVKVTDSSGEIDIEEIRGNVEVSDSSGDVLIANVTGNVTIPVDSSGGLTFRRVQGAVHIETDSSGDIAIDQVNHDVQIDNDSSGDIRVSGVGGNLTVAHDSSGDIEHRNVLGSVRIPASKRDD
jgi:hypothetical protein